MAADKKGKWERKRRVCTHRRACTVLSKKRVGKKALDVALRV